MDVLNFKYTLLRIALGLTSLSLNSLSLAGVVIPIEACVAAKERPLTPLSREKIARCLGWQADASSSICHGTYLSTVIDPLADADEIQMVADDVSLFANGRSRLSGAVEVQQGTRLMYANTAYIYRDEKANTITKIVLLDGVRLLEPDRLMLAQKAIINPQDKSGHVENVLYRINTGRSEANLPAWGRASWVERFPSHIDWMRDATYTTCPPKDLSWEIEARDITIDDDEGKGVAKDAVLRIGRWPVLYTPYLSFPTTKRRKSGFLMSTPGYSNVGGFDLAIPYYWNIAPNKDATITPHMYTLRGLMMGGNFRFLTDHSTGIIGGAFLPKDKAYQQFLLTNQTQFPSLQGQFSNRWSLLFHETSALTRDLQMDINFQQVSDDYYLQDFSSNLAVLTENQLLRQGGLTYTTDHWVMSGQVQSYQTIHPIDQSPIANIYQRLPQLMARGTYNELPLNANFNILGEFDYFQWPANTLSQPQGSRYHLAPQLSFPLVKPWGYVTPAVEVVENDYDVNYIGGSPSNRFQRTIPRYGIDSGLTFERQTNRFTQTLEPRLFYLNVPYHNQTAIPDYESAYMIFNHDQLFRTNRFSGFDRIGDTHQLSYALTSRWLSPTGEEKANLSIGQIRYFADRRVGLCYGQMGSCVDNPLFLGYLSPLAKSSPIASRGVYQLSPTWTVTGDYVWDVYTHGTNNGNVNFHYQPATNHILHFGYTYLTDGNLLQLPSGLIQNNPLHQATVAYAWPLSEQWSSLGAYSYNVSKSYGMMGFLGVQYDNCCWAVRLMGGRTFQSLTPDAITPRYNNNVYLQIVLKGLGSVASSDPATTISTYLPGFVNAF